MKIKCLEQISVDEIKNLYWLVVEANFKFDLSVRAYIAASGKSGIDYFTFKPNITLRTLPVLAGFIIDAETSR